MYFANLAILFLFFLFHNTTSQHQVIYSLKGVYLKETLLYNFIVCFGNAESEVFPIFISINVLNVLLLFFEHIAL